MNHLPPDVQEPGKDDPFSWRKGWKRIGLAALGLAALIGCRTCYVNERDQRAVEQQQRMDPQAIYMGTSDEGRRQFEVNPALFDVDHDGDLDSILVFSSPIHGLMVFGHHEGLYKGHALLTRGASGEIIVTPQEPLRFYSDLHYMRDPI